MSIAPLAPIVCPPAVYSRRLCLTPRADGTTVDGHLLEEYFDSLEEPIAPLAPIVCPPAVYSRRLCLTPRADGTTVDSLEEYFDSFELPTLSVQIVRYTVEQIEEQESTSAPTCAELFPEYNVCQQCKDIALHCKCDYYGDRVTMNCDYEEEEDGPPCYKCKWQDIALVYREEGERCPHGFNRCFCDLLIEFGSCPECMAWECKCLPEEEEEEEEEEYDGQDEVFQLPSWRNADMM